MADDAVSLYAIDAAESDLYEKRYARFDRVKLDVPDAPPRINEIPEKLDRAV